MLSILYLYIGLRHTHDAATVVIIIYGLTYFFSNFGPNISTYTIPGEIFPTTCRSTAHGISAAAGKIGAFLGAIFMKPEVVNIEFGPVFVVCACLSGLGFFWTLIFIPKFSPEKKNVLIEKEEKDKEENENA